MWEMLSITGELSSAYLPLAPAAGAELGESLSHECLALGFGVCQSLLPGSGTAVFSLCPQVLGGMKEFSALPYKGTNLIMRVPPSWPNSY